MNNLAVVLVLTLQYAPYQTRFPLCIFGVESDQA
jgi:hypothetical protein